MKQTVLIFLQLIFLSQLQAQNENDSLPVVTLAQVYEQVLTHHPVAKQADLISENARMNIRLSRGYFDPKIASKYKGKEFKDKNYYQIWDTYLTVPLWIGELKAGHEKNTGIRLNPENDTDSGNGLAYAGIEIPVLQGLLIDKRRATLREAQAFQREADAERVKNLNKLILQIAKDYWNWYFYFHQLKLARKGYELANFRFDAVKNRVKQGTLAPIDSVEAKITIQQREIDYMTAQMEIENARLVLSNHFWDESGQPLELLPDIQPMKIPQETLEKLELGKLLEYASVAHPEIVKLDAKLDQINVQRRLAAEMLKPKLNLKYNVLSRLPISNTTFDVPHFQQNYKVGVDFSFPLFLRKERGKLQMTKIKQETTQAQKSYTLRNIQTSLQAHYNTANNYENIVERQLKMRDNYKRLLDGEKQKFEAGSSSIFYMNVREGKYLESYIKLYKARAQYAKSLAELKWAAGLRLE